MNCAKMTKQIEMPFRAEMWIIGTIISLMQPGKYNLMFSCTRCRARVPQVQQRIQMRHCLSVWHSGSVVHLMIEVTLR